MKNGETLKFVDAPCASQGKTMSDLTPDRMETIIQKHIALKGWEKRARHVLERPEMSDKYIMAIRRIVHIAEELEMLAKTSEEQGRRWGWWK